MYSATDVDVPAEDGVEGPREGTRDRVLQAVLGHGPVSAARVGELLGLTAAAVRRHLDALSEEGAVEVKLVAGNRGAGRPSRRYVVSHVGQSRLGNDYLEVASRALGHLAEVGGPDAVRNVARERFAAVEDRYREAIGTTATLRDRAAALARVLDEEGFHASVRLVGQPGAATRHPSLRAAQICQGHCPLQEIAADFPEFCEEETELFARLLGVDVRRLATLPTGGHVCTTHVPLGREPDVPSGVGSTAAPQGTAPDQTDSGGAGAPGRPLPTDR
ncbi:metalloregulator ArsR/SmtB family transcription factor [Citricoccus sp. SGAir0253]|uniref:helix-turn-helix transcriptional regulator n=1 Tax=Citricoccus sp. SGAir0253 TaxID=2567881 RepID=UPI001FEF434F|nr:helix-turn-helix domain-containing protein [Citricoccus sp. SGAir0253]